MPIIRKILVAFILGVSIAILAGAGWVWQVTGAYGFNSIWRRGGTYWTSMKPDDERLSPSMRLALTRPAAIAQPGPMGPEQDWCEIVRLAEKEMIELDIRSKIRSLNSILPLNFLFSLGSKLRKTYTNSASVRFRTNLVLTPGYREVEFGWKF